MNFCATRNVIKDNKHHSNFKQQSLLASEQRGTPVGKNGSDQHSSVPSTPSTLADTPSKPEAVVHAMKVTDLIYRYIIYVKVSFNGRITMH